MTEPATARARRHVARRAARCMTAFIVHIGHPSFPLDAGVRGAVVWPGGVQSEIHMPATTSLATGIALALILACDTASAQPSRADKASPRPFEILDNSFLVEEAFNQEE